MAVEPAGSLERIATRRASLGVAACVLEEGNPGKVGTSVSTRVVAHEVLPTLVAAPNIENEVVDESLTLGRAAVVTVPVRAGEESMLSALAADGIRVARLSQYWPRVAPVLQFLQSRTRRGESTQIPS